MDHFENIISTLLEAEGYWVRRSFKLNVTKEEKRQIGKHSIPRPEIDLLALHYSRNELLALEAKSFLDSPGEEKMALLVTRGHQAKSHGTCGARVRERPCHHHCQDSDAMTPDKASKTAKRFIMHSSIGHSGRNKACG
jgi:hypothetical protein